MARFVENEGFGRAEWRIGMSEKKKLEIYCNNCGRQLKTQNGLLLEDAFEGSKEWGYFSKKDLEVHSFVLCEECCDRIAGGFRIPVNISKKQEVM